jgi:hypothetical protein
MFINLEEGRNLRNFSRKWLHSMKPLFIKKEKKASIIASITVEFIEKTEFLDGH